jgi:hypothetical protein
MDLADLSLTFDLLSPEAQTVPGQADRKATSLSRSGSSPQGCIYRSATGPLREREEARREA